MFETSLIILTFNSIRFIKSCLESVFVQDYKDFEVIVVDNGSRDGTIAFIEENYPQTRVIKNKKNLGACKGRNQGIEIAQGRWILTLDCDVILSKDFLSKIISFANNSADSVGMFQPKILQKDKKTIYSCGIYLSKLRRFYDLGAGMPDGNKFDKTGNIFGACCAAALYKRQMLEDLKEKTGYFDGRFFFLVEDVDLAWRAQKRGLKTVYYPEAACYHSGNSSGYDKKFRQYLCFRNRYYSIIKNEGIKDYVKRIYPLLFYDIPRIFYLTFTNPYVR